MPRTVRPSAVCRAVSQALLLWQPSAAALLKALPEIETFSPDPLLEAAPEEEFTITRDSRGAFLVEGPLVDRITRGINIDEYQSLRHFQHLLVRTGIIDALRQAGAKDGDEVCIKDIDFDFID